MKTIFNTAHFSSAFLVLSAFTTSICAMDTATHISAETITPSLQTRRTTALDEQQTRVLRRAEAGEVDAQLTMGKFYYNNKYRSKTRTKEEAEGNKVEAVKWLTRAANKNHAEAQYLLGKCHYHALGVTRNTMIAGM